MSLFDPASLHGSDPRSIREESGPSCVKDEVPVFLTCTFSCMYRVTISNAPPFFRWKTVASRHLDVGNTPSVRAGHGKSGGMVRPFRRAHLHVPRPSFASIPSAVKDFLSIGNESPDQSDPRPFRISFYWAIGPCRRRVTHTLGVDWKAETWRTRRIQAMFSASTNRNVSLAVAFSALISAASSMWSANLPTYVLVLTGSNVAVGMTSGVQGICRLIAAFPAGYLADKCRRDGIIRISGAVGIVGTALLMSVLLEIHFQHESVLGYKALCVAVGVMGVFMGMNNPPIESLFADSIPLGTRTKLYTIKQSVYVFSSAIGPALSLGMYLVLGNNWSLWPALTLVLCLSGAMMLAPAILCFFFNDDLALGEESGSIAESTSMLSVNGQEQEEGKIHFGCISESMLVPALVCGGDFVISFASGMTVRFFPVFFSHDLKLSPIMVNLVYVLNPIGMGLGTMFAKHLASFTSRPLATILLKVSGISLLVIMCFTKHVPLIIALFVVRTSLMNSNQALSRSIIMDFVPKKHRGKWNTIESVNVFSWAGSAVLGGFLVDSIGYRHTFLATAVMQFISLVPWFLLIRLVPNERDYEVIPTATTAIGSQASDLRLPLLDERKRAADEA